MAVDPKLIKQLREMTSAGIVDCQKALVDANSDLDKAVELLRERGAIKSAKKADRVAAEGITYVKENDKQALIMEVNAETDFVSRNDKFLQLIEDVADAILAANSANLDGAHSAKTAKGHTVQEALNEAVATIGEKIVLRRFELVNKEAGMVTGLYNHSNKRISVLVQFIGGEITDKDARGVAMHIAAMAPAYKTVQEIPADFKDKELNVIRENAKADPSFGKKPAEVQDKILGGKLDKRLAEVTLSEQPFVLDEGFKVGEFIKNKHSLLKTMIRYEVGEGIEKIVTDFAAEVAAQVKGN